MEISLKKSKPLHGEVRVAPDKSISHRALIMGALAHGDTLVRNFLVADDTISTCRCLRQLGVDIQEEEDLLRVRGRGRESLAKANSVLYCGNSGTTMRLLAGLVASLPFGSVLTGDESLNGRPMRRIIAPLRLMGAGIKGRENDTFPPLNITGRTLLGIEYTLPVASAQVKSAILLAALGAEGSTRVIEPQLTRNHTERMLAAMGADLYVTGQEITITPGKKLLPQEFQVPGDFSSAAFFIVAGLIVPGSELYIKDVGLNPTRAGLLKVLEKMGGSIRIENRRLIGGEEIADLVVSSSQLRGIEVGGEEIGILIDEIPVLAVAMAAAQGRSSVRGAGELRVKESDRIRAVSLGLRAMGVEITEQEDGFVINGNGERINGARVNSFGDHRIAMSLAVAGLTASADTIIEGAEAVNISFPDFWNLLNTLQR